MKGILNFNEHFSFGKEIIKGVWGVALKATLSKEIFFVFL